jgi:exonuclease SbcC
MKILAIRLKNLASLAGPFELDFTAEPLASAGLFAITGPTGAGKSTLLDALCLALFGAIPRLSNVGQSKVPEIDGDISTNDPRTLLRRGTGSGYAEVDFVGIDQRRYRARWETNRARDNATKKLQASRQTLTDLDSEQILSSQNKTEYKSMLEARLGLNFEQFTRAVMLAQSEFSAFLKADDKERSELLEKLTDTAIYSQLGRRAFSKAREAEKAHDELKARSAGISPLNEEERTALDQRLLEEQGQLKTHQARLKQLEQQQQWLTLLGQLQEARQAAAEQLQQARNEEQQQGAERLKLGRLEQLATQRHQFVRQQELNSQLTPLAAQIDAQNQQQQALHTQLQQLEGTQQQAHATLVDARQQLADAAPLLRQAFDEQSQLARLNQDLSQADGERQQLDEQCTQGQQALQGMLDRQQASSQRLELIATQLQQSNALAPLAEAWTAWRDRLKQAMLIGNRLSQGQAELPALEQRANSASEQLNQHRSALDLLYREAGAEAHAVTEQIQLLGNLLQDNRKQQRSVEELARLWARLQELDSRALELNQKHQQAQQERERLTAEGLQAKNELTVAEQTLSVTRQLLERQRLARSASVEELRGQLQDDQPCPVCGSHEHPYHQPEVLLDSLGRHDEQEESNALKVVTALNERLNDLRTQVGALIAQQKDSLQQQEQLAPQQQALGESLVAHTLGARLLEQNVNTREAWLNQQLSQLQHNIAQDEQRQNALLTLQQDAARLQQQVQATGEASQLANHQWQDQQRQLSGDRERLEQELEAFSAVLSAEHIDGLRTQAAQTVMQLEQQVGERLAQLDQRNDEQQEQRERQQKIELEQASQQAREKDRARLTQHCSELSTRQQASQQQLAQWLGAHVDAEHWQQHLQQQEQQAREAESSAAQTLQDSRTQLLQLASELKAKAERLDSLQQELQQLVGKIDEWRARHPEMSDEELAGLLAVDDEQLSQLRQRLHNTEKAIEQFQVLLQEREERLTQHQAQHNGDLPAEQLASATAELHTQLAASEDLCAELRARQSEDQRRQQANQALAQQIEQASQQWQRWARLSTLIGSAEGDRFRKIAQAYNLDLLVHHANSQLRQLVRRYRLKRGGSMLGLLVMDTEMGDELRSVHSLSGGETFLVSLALALGLASMASNTLKIESLFIDEGFGSLDPESLQLAMDALDGLQAQGRKVGVISHVQEMHERIPVQIQVRRQGNGLSTIEVT